MLGESVPEEDPHWECFFQMLTIVDYIFAPVTSGEIATYLKELIQDHHELFTEVYPTSPVIPKMHYMIHIPDWMER